MNEAISGLKGGCVGFLQSYIALYAGNQWSSISSNYVPPVALTAAFQELIIYQLDDTAFNRGIKIAMIASSIFFGKMEGQKMFENELLISDFNVLGAIMMEKFLGKQKPFQASWIRENASLAIGGGVAAIVYTVSPLSALILGETAAMAVSYFDH